MDKSNKKFKNSSKKLKKLYFSNQNWNFIFKIITGRPDGTLLYLFIYHPRLTSGATNGVVPTGLFFKKKEHL
jgi:hypothetical protein